MAAAGLLLGATVVRLWYLLVHGGAYFMGRDDQNYLMSALQWMNHGVFSYGATEPNAFVMPGYPALIALALKAGTYDRIRALLGLQLFQLALWTAAGFVLYRIGRRWGTPWIGFLATLIYVAYLPGWTLNATMMTEGVFVPFQVFVLAAALRLFDRASLGCAALLGLLLAATIYVRPQITPWIVVALGVGVLWRRITVRRALQSLAVIALIGAVCLAPWWIRNYRSLGERFVPFAESSGNPLLLGTFIGGIPAEEDLEKMGYFERWYRDKQDRELAIGRIKDGFTNRPWRHLRWYFVEKPLVMWTKVTYGAPYYETIAGIPQRWTLVGHYVLLGLAAIGTWVYRRNTAVALAASMVIYHVALCVVFLSSGRYAAPSIPFVCLLAGFGLWALWGSRGRSIRR